MENNVEGRRKCLNSVPYIVTEEMNKNLTSEILEKEVEMAVKDLPNNKTPGLDSIPNELLKVLWNIVGNDITEMLDETLNIRILHPPLNEGLTSMIPKSDILINIRNFRPIAVLTSTYKIMAKTLVNILQPILPKVILPTQTAFVKERSILDNIVLATEAIHQRKRIRA